LALIIRIDVDRPYGRSPIYRHVLSRLTSDCSLPPTNHFGYLRELTDLLQLMNDRKARGYLFFRRCTRPSPAVLQLIESGGHEIGLHLENSRSFETFRREKNLLEAHVGKAVTSVSKHGSGGSKFGFHHYAPYEPNWYVDWAKREGMTLFLGNLQDPSIATERTDGLLAFPSAFWLEPHWRDTVAYPVSWLLSHAQTKDIVLLVHPENVLASRGLTADFLALITALDSRIL
jgi:hypothetical protein